MKRAFTTGLAWIGLLAGAALLCPTTALAAWVLNGDAANGVGNQIILTPDLNDQAGSAWIETQIDMSQDFDISFEVFLGDSDAGADGISFALHNDSNGTSAFGDTSGGGEWIGMNGICPAVTVEVDTYQNTGRGDPAADHLGMNIYTGTSGSCSGVPNHNGSNPAPVQADPGSANIEDNTIHELRVTWDVSTNTMSVYFDGSFRFSHTQDFINTVFGGNPDVYFGFTASTGGATNEQWFTPNSAAMAATKGAAPDTFLAATPNKQTTYTIDITNTGDVTAFGTQIQDTLPVGFTYVTGSTTGATTTDPSTSMAGGRQVLDWNLSATPIDPGGGTASIAFVVDIAPSVGVGTHRNDFQISGDNFTTINETQTATITIGPIDLSIDKAHTGRFTAGQTNDFTIDVSNAGPDIANNIVVTDTMPTGFTYGSHSGSGWTVDLTGAPATVIFNHAGPLASGASLPQLTVSVDVADSAAPQVTNQVDVTADESETNAADNTDSDVIDVNNADLAVVKTSGGTITVGATGTFTLDVSSSGPDTATNISITDTLPAGLTYQSFTSTDANWTVNTSGLPTVVFNHPGPLASGASLAQVEVTVLADLSGAPSVNNTATVDSDLPDTNAANDSSTANIAIDPGTADLSVDKAHTGTFTAGTTNDFTIDVANAGPDPATSISVTDTMPAGFSYDSHSGAGWTVDLTGAPATVVFDHAGPLASGASLPQLIVTVNVTAAAAPQVTNQVAVSAVQTDPNGANDTDSDVIDVYHADLSVVKAHSGDFTESVDGVFTLDVSSSGPDSTANIVVTDTLPAGLTYQSFTSSDANWTVDLTGLPTTVVFNHPGPLASGGSLAQIQMTVAVGAAAVPSADNTAVVTSDLPDTNAANDTSVDTVTVNAASADVSVQKNHVGFFTQGNTGDYSIVVSNEGPLSATNIVVTDTLPGGGADLTYDSFTSTDGNWSVDLSGLPGTVVFNHPGPLAAGASLAPITLTVTAQASAVPSTTNTVSVAADEVDPDGSDDSDSDVTTVQGAAAGNKPLYIRGNTTRLLSRDPTAGTTTNVGMPGSGGSNFRDWTLDVSTAGAIDLTPAAAQNVLLYVHRNTQTPPTTRTVDVELFHQPSGGGALTLIGDNLGYVMAFAGAGSGNTAFFTVPLTIVDTTIPAGSDVILRITNVTGINNRWIIVHPEFGGGYSMVDLNVLDVLNIDGITFWDDAADSGGTQQTILGGGSDVYVRAEISDPFGEADIGNVTFDLVDADTLTVVSGQAPTDVNAIDAASNLYEFGYTLPLGPTGTWTARVTAEEGTEGFVTDVDVATFTLEGPIFEVTKVYSVISDSYTVNPANQKPIPGALLEYSVTVQNDGRGEADDGSFSIVDSIPTETRMFVGDLGGGGNGPVQLAPGGTCGLSYSFTSLGSTADDVDFSSTDTSTWTYTPSGTYDENVRHIRITPTGGFLANPGTPPACTFHFRVQLR